MVDQAVKVKESFTSDNSEHKVVLDAGLSGLIKKIDSDVDIHVLFPSLQAEPGARMGCIGSCRRILRVFGRLIGLTMQLERFLMEMRIKRMWLTLIVWACN